MSKFFPSAREVLTDHKKRNLPQNFCLVPFTSLILEPDGKVGCCRQKGSEFPVGNIKTESLEEIWNGEAMRGWRREFLSGKVKNCETEVRHRACHLCPENNDLLEHVSLEEVQNGRPLRLTLNLNGKCNLHCRMCHIWEKPNGLYDQIGFWKTLEDYVPSLKEVELLSGEPFIQKDTYRLVELFSRKNPDCLWSITSNGHWKLTDTIRTALDKIRFRCLIISVDSLVPETYALIRQGGTLSVVLENLERLRDYEVTRVERGLGKLNLHLNFLVQKDNWKELGSFHDYGKKNGIEIFRSFVYGPHEHSLLSLSEPEREEILDYYLTRLSHEQISHSMRVILPLIDSLPKLSRGDFLLRYKSQGQARTL